MKTSARKNKAILGLLVVLFASPSLVAYWLYRHPTSWHAASINRGTLITTPTVLSSMPSRDVKWHLVYWDPQACDAACLDAVEKIARVRIALGRRLYHVDVVLLQDESTKALSAAPRQSMHALDVREVRLSASDVKTMQALSPSAAYFLMNPQQQLVLRYARQAPADDLFHDIKHLLGQSGL